MTSSRRRGGERGASILELAFITPVMVLLVMGVIDLARGYQMQIQLENAAREGAAFAQLYPNDVVCAGEDDITDRAEREEEGGVKTQPDYRVDVFAEDDMTGDLTDQITGCGSGKADPGEQVLVEVSATFDILTPMVERVVGNGVTITGSAEIGVQ